MALNTASQWSCEQLVEAVNATMDPEVSQDKRQEAYRICESFKESSPNLVPFGIELSSVGGTSIIRHFGLQLVEHAIKFRWNKMKVEDKILIKNTMMRYIQEGTKPILQEDIYIKDGLAKSVVEMIKREYPQQWPTMLEELQTLCELGETQTELVMLIWLRLVEDVMTFQSVPQTRRKEINQAINAQMQNIFSLLMGLLTLYTENYKKQSLEGLGDLAQASCRVAESVLMTLAAFIEFVPSQHLFRENNSLLRVLYMLLSIPALRLRTAECLQILVHRKGKIEDREPVLILLSEDAMNTILNSAREVSEATAENSYNFLTQLCQVVCGLTFQLCAIWGAEGSTFQRPHNIGQCFTTLLAFTSHPSVYLSHTTLPQWQALMKHPQISKDPALHAILPELLKTLTRTLQKVGLPSRNDDVSCKFSVMDFDSDDEFMQFFPIHRSHQVDLVRNISSNSPKIAFNIAAEWLKQLLVTPLQTEKGHTLCTYYSPSWYQWDALTSFMDSVMGRALTEDDSLNEQALQLLHCALDADVQDPLILSCVLTCVSALFPSLKRDPQQVQKVIEKLFAAAVYSVPGQTKKTRTRPVQNVRRHACCALVRMCLDHPELMVPFFDQIYAKVQSLIQDPEQLTKLERVNLNETLILISNQFQDFAKQSALIEEVLEPVSSVWLGETTKNMIFPPEAFLHHVGLDEFPTSPSQEEALGANRAHITTCLTHILAVMKRSCSPSNMEEATKGGFVRHQHGKLVLANPAAPHVLPMLDHVLLLCLTLNSIWTPPLQAKVCPEYKKAFEIPVVKKNSVLGTQSSLTDSYELPANRPMAEKTQSFLQTIHDQCCHILATACQNIGAEFFNSPGLLNHLMQYVFNNVEYLPNFKLRNVIRVVLKSMVLSCPPDHYNSLLVPLLSRFCSFMLQRLSKEWEQLAQKLNSSADVDDEDSESQEILADNLIRLITREYIDLIKLCLKKDVDSESEEVGELGECLLKDWDVLSCLMFTVYSAISWADSAVCLKVASLTSCLLPRILNNAEHPLLPDGAAEIFASILGGLTIHGETESCRAVLTAKGLWHYEVMRPKYETVEKVLNDIPGTKANDVNAFTRRFILETNKPLPEKRKKDAFKRIVEGIVAEPVSQQHRRKIEIRNLPPIYRPRKVKQELLDVTKNEQELGMVALFADAGD